MKISQRFDIFLSDLKGGRERKLGSWIVVTSCSICDVVLLRRLDADKLKSDPCLWFGSTVSFTPLEMSFEIDP